MNILDELTITIKATEFRKVTLRCEECEFYTETTMSCDLTVERAVMNAIEFHYNARAAKQIKQFFNKS